MTDPVAERDAGVTKRELDGARGLADYAMREDGGEAAVMRIRAGFVIRLLDALAAERQRGREEMRDRAARIACEAGEPWRIHTSTGAMAFRAVTEKIAAAILSGAELPAPTITVNPLAWSKTNEAQTPFGVYSVRHDADEDVAGSPWCAWTPNESLGHFATEDDARSALAAHHEQVVRSMIGSTAIRSLSTED